MQLNLPLTDLPSGDGTLWEQLDQTARDAVIDALARAIARVVTQSRQGQRENDDE
jgi:hypothetical protein